MFLSFPLPQFLDFQAFIEVFSLQLIFVVLVPTASFVLTLFVSSPLTLFL
jgi:hypothetical protein